MKASTPEQKAAKAARREKFRAMVKQVAAMTEAERAQIVSRVGAVLTCEGRALSPVNTTLLLMQMPNASLVGGFRQWLKAQKSASWDAGLSERDSGRATAFMSCASVLESLNCAPPSLLTREAGKWPRCSPDDL